jgi:hypothetical protein
MLEAGLERRVVRPAPSGYGGVQPFAGQPSQFAHVPYGHTGQAAAYGQNQGVIGMLGQKSSRVAAILSILLVGAGQIYCGQSAGVSAPTAERAFRSTALDPRRLA